MMPNKPILTILLTLLIPTPSFAQNTNSQLIEAATNGHTETVQALLEAGAEVDAKDEDGMTPLMWAAFGGHGETVMVLLDAGADVSMKDKQGTTARLWSANSETRQLLKDPVSRLIDAATNGKIETVRKLLDVGVDVNAKGKDKLSALFYAANKGHSDIVQFLIEAGSDVNAKDSGDINVLMVASRGGDPDTVRALLAAGADVEAKDKQGRTALLFTSETPIVMLLRDFQQEATPQEPVYILDIEKAIKNNPLPKAHTPEVKMVANSEGSSADFRVSWKAYPHPVLGYRVYIGAKKQSDFHLCDAGFRHDGSPNGYVEFRTRQTGPNRSSYSRGRFSAFQ